MAIDENYFYGAHGLDIEKSSSWDVIVKIRTEIEECMKINLM